MGDKALRLLVQRPLRSPGFFYNLLTELQVKEKFKPEEILYLTPNKRRARKACFEILNLYGNRVNQEPVALDIHSLARNLLETRKGIVDEQDRQYILLKLIYETRKGTRDEIGFKEEHLGLLSSLYAELKRFHPEGWIKIPDIARKMMYDLDAAKRLKNALDLLNHYETYLNEQNLLDHEMLLEEAISQVKPLPYKLLIIEGYFQPWASEKRLFNTLLESIPEVIVIIPDHLRAVEGERFFLSFDLEVKQIPKANPDSSSCWHRYPSREDEVIAIARRICYLAQEGVYPEDIMVVFPALETYRPIVERIFERYALQAKMAQSKKFINYPAIQQVLNLVNAAAQGYSRRDIVGLVLSPCFKSITESVRRWIDILSRKEGIVSGEKAWTGWSQKFLAGELRNSKDPSGLAREIRDFLNELVKRLKKFTHPTSVVEFVKQLKDVLDWLGWDVPDEIRHGFDVSLEKLIRMSELAGEETVSASFLMETLRMLFKREVPKFAEDTGEDGIRVVPLVESRWLEIDYLFVGGLVDGEFPARPHRDLLVPERLREVLSFPTVEAHYVDALFEFHRLLAMCNRQAFLSAPSMDADRPMLPSVFLTEREEDTREDVQVVYCEAQRQILEPFDKGAKTEGVIFRNTEAVQLIVKKFGEAFSFRVTRLEIYRNCPYRYYLSTVLGLDVAEEPTQEPEIKLLGIVMHDVLERLFSRGLESERAGSQLEEYLGKELDSRRLNPFVKLWIRDWIKARKDWFVDEEISRVEEGWRVETKWLERKLTYDFSDFRIIGRVDRVDWQDDKARVLDYKTGKELNFEKRIANGESIQLPLYAEIVRRLYGAVIESIGIYGFAARKIEKIPYPDQAIGTALRYVSQAIQEIRKGSFPANKTPSCRYCEYHEFC